MAFTPRNPAFEAVARESYARQHFMRHLGAELGEIAPGHCTLHLKARQELTQQNGFLHGGAIEGSDPSIAPCIAPAAGGTEKLCAAGHSTLMSAGPDLSGLVRHEQSIASQIFCPMSSLLGYKRTHEQVVIGSASDGGGWRL